MNAPTTPPGGSWRPHVSGVRPDPVRLLRQALVLALVLAMGMALYPSNLLPRAEAATGGPVILDGTDAGLHGSIVKDGSTTPEELRTTWLYMYKAWETLLAGVPSGYAHNGRVAVVGASPDSTSTSNNCGAAVGYIAERLGTPVTVDYYDGVTAIGSFFDGVLSGTHRYAMVQIVEQQYCGNGMDGLEAAEVDTHGPAIAAHVNRGGALFTQYQNYGWLNSLFPDLSRSTTCSGSTPNLTAAGFAQFPGLSDSDIAAPWHNCFVLATGAEWPLEQLALQSNTDVVILGGGAVELPTNVDLRFVPEQPRPGEQACAIATVTDGGTPVQGATVEFTRTGDSGTETASVATDVNGEASYCYTASASGNDEVTATVASGPGQGSSTGELVWSAAALTAAPGTTNLRGEQVCVTAAVATVSGGVTTPTEGVTVSFAVSGVNSPTASSGTTDAAGEAQYCYTGANGGSDVLTASLPSGDSRSTTLYWAGPRVSISSVGAELGETGRVIPITVEEFTGSTNVEAVLTLPASGGTMTLDGTGLTLTDSSLGATGFTSVRTLQVTGSLADVTTALGSRVTWNAPASSGDTTLEVVVTDTATPTVTAAASRTLTLFSAPAFTTQPADTTVTAGATATFTAAVSGGPAPTVTWEQLAPTDGATWEAVTGATGTTLTVVTTDAHDGYQYRAVATNSKGSATSTQVLLTVDPAPTGPTGPTTPVFDPTPTPVPPTGDDGGSGSTVDGEPRTLTVSGDSTSTRASVGDVVLEATPVDSTGRPTGTNGGRTLQVPGDGSVHVEAAGMAPDHPVVVWLVSVPVPVQLGEARTSDEGVLVATAMALPSGLDACGHLLQVVGASADGARVEVALDVWLLASPYPFADVRPDGLYGPSVGCLESRGVVTGYERGDYEERRAASRGETATMLARTLGLTGGSDLPFGDTQGVVHSEGIAALFGAGLVQGYEDGSFRPGGQVTRGQLVMMLVSGLGLEPQRGTGLPTDVPDGALGDAVRTAMAVGLVGGYEDGTFRPSAPIGRGELALVLVRVDDLPTSG